jgi:hypothetical protein
LFSLTVLRFHRWTEKVLEGQSKEVMRGDPAAHGRQAADAAAQLPSLPPPM